MHPLLFLLLILQLPCPVCQLLGGHYCFHIMDCGDSKDGDVMLTAFLPICLYYVKMTINKPEEYLISNGRCPFLYTSHPACPAG